jgi:hypothetical protein
LKFADAERTLMPESVRMDPWLRRNQTTGARGGLKQQYIHFPLSL